MGWLSKKQPPEADPAYSHMVGRLVGATGMLTSYMMLHGDDPAKGMAQRVDELLAFFIEDYSPVSQHLAKSGFVYESVPVQQQRPTTPGSIPLPEADTQIIPPKPSKPFDREKD